MARDEHDREDLLREATALVERVEFRLTEHAESVVAGFRRDGCFSIFFGAQSVYQFNSHGELRRAFVREQLLKAQRGRLVALRRERVPGRVELVRHELDEQETATLLSSIHIDLTSVRASLETSSAQLVGQVPADVNVLGRVQQWLASRRGPIAVAHRPHAR